MFFGLSALFPTLHLISRAFSSGVRRLLRRPLECLPQIAVLGLGVGGLAALAAVGKTLFLDQAPGIHLTTSLLWLNPRSGSVNGEGLSYLDYLDLSNGLRGAGEVIATRWFYQPPDQPGNRGLAVVLVSDNYFKALQVQPWGRDFESGTSLERLKSAVISNGLARRLYGNPHAAIGHELLINRYAVTVTGVAPPGFHGLRSIDQTDVFLPLETYDLVNAPSPGALGRRGDSQFEIAALPARSVGETQFRARADQVWSDIVAQYPGTHRGFNGGLAIERSRSGIMPSDYGWLTALLGRFTLVCSLVGLAAVTALVTLQAAVWTRRQLELSTRVALGANRARIALESAAESLPIGLVASGVAVLCSRSFLDAIRRMWLDDLPEGLPIATGDFAVFALLLSVGAVLGTTLLTVLRLMRQPTGEVLTRGGLGQTDPPGVRTRRRLILGTQVAVAIVVLALVLTNAAGTREAAEAAARNAIARSTWVLPITSASKSQASRAELQRQILAICPERCTFSSTLPLAGTPGREWIFNQTGDSVLVSVVTVGTGFFAVLGIAPLAGLETPSSEASRRHVLLSRSLADALAGPTHMAATTVRISGQGSAFGIDAVMPDIPFREMTAPGTHQLMFLPVALPDAGPEPLYLLSRDRVALNEVALRMALPSSIPAAEPRLIRDFVDEANAPARALLRLLLLAAGVGGAICLVGIYGNCALYLSARRRELGIRSALGAGTRRLIATMTSDAALALGAGSVGGGVVSAWLGLVLFTVPTDTMHISPGAIAGATFLIAFGGAVAVIGPSWRVHRINPMREIVKD